MSLDVIVNCHNNNNNNKKQWKTFFGRSIRLPTDRWISVELRLKMNSIGSFDGVVRNLDAIRLVWIDIFVQRFNCGSMAFWNWICERIPN
jgi:hypothetical protein